MRRFSAYLPWGILLLGFAIMNVEYPQLPDRWVIHYNAAGRADGWATKSFEMAFFPLFMGSGLAVIFEFIAQVSRLASGSQEAWQVRMQECNRLCLRLISASMAVFMCYLAWRMPYATGVGFIILPVVLLLGTVIVGPILCFIQAYREARQSCHLPQGYRLFYYYDPADPRVWIPKLSGGGWTLNLAHKSGRFWMVFLLAMPLLIAFSIIAYQAH